MKVRAQIAMVLNLDKCIGCHTCSVTCKNVWTSRDGMEYAWFNNVETKPGIGYPKNWEDQEPVSYTHLDVYKRQIMYSEVIQNPCRLLKRKISSCSRKLARTGTDFSMNHAAMANTTINGT